MKAQMLPDNKCLTLSSRSTNPLLNSSLQKIPADRGVGSKKGAPEAAKSSVRNLLVAELRRARRSIVLLDRATTVLTPGSHDQYGFSRFFRRRERAQAIVAVSTTDRGSE